MINNTVYLYPSLMSPEPTRPKSLILENLPYLLGRTSAPATPPGQAATPPDSKSRPFLLPEVEEIRLSPCTARKGYLNILEEKTKTWKRRWVVVRRPYVFLYREERDPCERCVINMATANMEYSPASQPVRVPNSFRYIHTSGLKYYSY